MFPFRPKINPIIREFFFKWTIPSLNLDMLIDANKCFSLKNQKNRTINWIDPDESARYEPSHLDLTCLHGYLVLVCNAERVNKNLNNLERERERERDLHVISCVSNSTTSEKVCEIFFMHSYYIY